MKSTVYSIVDDTIKVTVWKTKAANEKSALKKYACEKMFSTGLHEIVKDEKGYLLCFTFGRYYRAINTGKNEQGEKI